MLVHLRSKSSIILSFVLNLATGVTSLRKKMLTALIFFNHN